MPRKVSYQTFGTWDDGNVLALSEEWTDDDIDSRLDGYFGNTTASKTSQN